MTKKPRTQAAPPENIVAATSKNLKTGDEYPFHQIPNSRCFFSPTFHVEDYDIVLRLDWHPPNASGDPTLDADFKKPGTDEIDQTMRSHTSHQTRRTIDPATGKLLYDFQYKSLNLLLMVQLTNSRHQQGTARIESPDLG
jgi:hypothetical protein